MAQGDPVPGVDVSIEQSPGGIIISSQQTNGSGYYVFKDVPPGTYRLLIGQAPPPPRVVATVSGAKAYAVDVAIALVRSLHADPGIEVVVGKDGRGTIAGHVRAARAERPRT